MAKIIIKVPFDSAGNQISFPFINTKFKDNYEFNTTLNYNGFSRGRSALNIEWIDPRTEKTYQSGMSLLDECLREDSPLHSYMNVKGIYAITGNFTFKKQGTSVLLTSVKS